MKEKSEHLMHLIRNHTILALSRDYPNERVYSYSITKKSVCYVYVFQLGLKFVVTILHKIQHIYII